MGGFKCFMISRPTFLDELDEVEFRTRTAGTPNGETTVGHVVQRVRAARRRRGSGCSLRRQLRPGVTLDGEQRFAERLLGGVLDWAASPQRPMKLVSKSRARPGGVRRVTVRVDGDEDDLHLLELRLPLMTEAMSACGWGRCPGSRCSRSRGTSGSLRSLPEVVGFPDVSVSVNSGLGMGGSSTMPSTRRGRGRRGVAEPSPVAAGGEEGDEHSVAVPGGTRRRLVPEYRIENGHKLHLSRDIRRGPSRKDPAGRPWAATPREAAVSMR